MKWKQFLLAAALSCSLYYCGSKAGGTAHAAPGRATTAAGSYDLSKPAKTWNLPAELKEVSGNSWISNSRLLLIEDLHPNLYIIGLNGKGTIEKTIPFGDTAVQKFDIEDVALDGNIAYALWSHGVIYKIDNWQKTPRVTQLSTGLNKKNNTEGLCVDPVSHNLLVACKNKSGDEDAKKSDRAVYMFNTSSGKLNDEPFLLIKEKDFKKQENEKLDFFPSALAVHPLTHDIYILSTKETKGLAQFSYDGKLKNFQFIDKELMAQPEGICFSPEGILYITTEGRNGQPAKVLQFNPSK
jgi:uncharacterized protein YjiK